VTKEIRAKKGAPADVAIECAAKVMVVTKERPLTCKYTGDGKTEKITFTKAGGPTEFRWAITP
jgi:hypothetical protein